MQSEHGRTRAAVEALEPRTLAAGDFGFAAAIGWVWRDSAADVAANRAGNAYVTGRFSGTVDFDRSAATHLRTAAGGSDAFVAKYGPTGALHWVRTFGGPGADEGMALAVDAAGNALATGFFAGTVDFDPGAGVAKLTSAGPSDGFVVKLTAGGAFAWVRPLAGPAESGGTAIATDAAGAAYVMGMFAGSLDLDPRGTRTAASAGGYDVFLSKLTAAGSFVYGKSFGGAGTDYANGIAVDPLGHVHFVGSFSGAADFDPGPGTAQLASAGSSDVFVSKLGAAGSFVSARAVGGPGADQAGDVAADAAGNVYVTGNFTGTADFDPGPGAYRLASAGDADVFVLKFTPSANLGWARRVGGTGRDRGTDLAVDAAGSAYVTGHFAGSVDFDPNHRAYALRSSGASDAFVLKLATTGAMAWARRLGGAGHADVGEGICLGPGRALYTVGRFAGAADFDPAGATAHWLTSSGAADEDGYLSKLVNC